MAPAWSHVETRVFVATPMGTIGIHVQDGSENVERRYLHRDHLGSVVAVTGEPSGGTAPVLAEYSFDAWGVHRDASDWSPITNNQQLITTSKSSDRGFTGHEMLDHLGLVHMNGRIYDSALGRFLSPDPLIQAPENLQSFNRYSYVFNNPLTHVDPSGFAVKSKKASGEAATASTRLDAPIESTELSSQDNIGGTETESSKQSEDYYSDSNGNTQVDQTAQPQKETTPGTTDDAKKKAKAVTRYEQNGEVTAAKLYAEGQAKLAAAQALERKFDGPTEASRGLRAEYHALREQRLQMQYNKAQRFFVEGGDDPVFVYSLWTGVGALRKIGQAGLRRLFTPRQIAPKTINNSVPSRMARVVPDTPITRASGTLGRPGSSDVFVTAADDIAGMNANQISKRLTIPQSPTGYRIMEFSTPSSGVASPILRTDPGFIGGGRTLGGAREFVIPNGSIPYGVNTTVIRP